MISSVIFLEPKGTILEVLRAAKVRGYHIVALYSDPSLLEHTPEPYQSAAVLIDEFHSVDRWEDEKALVGLCEKINATHPIAGLYAGLDPCARTLANLRCHFGLPSARPEDVSTVLNKYRLRARLRTLGLSDLRHYSREEAENWTRWRPPGAVYFKPVHGFFSAYVRRCQNLEQLRSAQSAWSTGNATDPEYVRAYLRSSSEYHLEEAIEGELLSVEAIVSRGQFKPLGLLSRIMYSKNPVIEMGSCFPYEHPLASRIIQLVRDAHEALGLTDGPTHTEVIVSPEGRIEIIDLNPRFVGADVLQSINHAYGLKIQDALLDYALGKDPNIEPKTRLFSCLQYLLPPEVRTLETISLPTCPEVRFSATFIRPGSPIENTGQQLNYLGCYLTVMPTFETALKRSHELRASVRINGQTQGVY